MLPSMWLSTITAVVCLRPLNVRSDFYKNAPCFPKDEKQGAELLFEQR